MAFLDKTHTVASILSLVLIPTAIAVVGWWIQSSLSEQSVKKDYVQIAVGILSDQRTADDSDLRSWATEVLSKNSPVPFKPTLRDKFIAGKTLTDFAWVYPVITPKPPAKLMEPPQELLEPLPENSLENAKRSKENAERLKNLQEWIKNGDKNKAGWRGVAKNLGLDDEFKASR